MEHTYTAQELIDLLGMVPHEEGGWYAFVTSSGVSIPAGTVPGIQGARDSCSIIYYLLQKGEISRWHQLRASEVWAWHMGGSLEMTLGGTGDAPRPEGTLSLGPRLREGVRFQGVYSGYLASPAGGRGLCPGLLRGGPRLPRGGLSAAAQAPGQ